MAATTEDTHPPVPSRTLTYESAGSDLKLEQLDMTFDEMRG